MGDRLHQRTIGGQKEALLSLLGLQRPALPNPAPKDWLEKIKKREPQLSQKRATNVAFVEHMDHEIGKVLDAVKELGIEKDT